MLLFSANYCSKRTSKMLHWEWYHPQLLWLPNDLYSRSERDLYRQFLIVSSHRMETDPQLTLSLSQTVPGLRSCWLPLQVRARALGITLSRPWSSQIWKEPFWRKGVQSRLQFDLEILEARYLWWNRVCHCVIQRLFWTDLHLSCIGCEILA